MKAIEGDKGLVVKNPAAHHAISAKFDKKVDNKGKALVVQYEVKLQSMVTNPFYRQRQLTRTPLDGLECGGAYMKLLRDNKELHADEFSNASPYVIMFGPDKCGATNKVCKIGSHMVDHLLTTMAGSLHFPAQKSQDWRVRGEAPQEPSDGSNCQDYFPLHFDCQPRSDIRNQN